VIFYEKPVQCLFRPRRFNFVDFTFLNKSFNVIVSFIKPLRLIVQTNLIIEMEKDFVEMLNTHRGIIYKVCNLYCHDEEAKKDLFQEIVLQLWKAYPNFRSEALNTSWMYRVGLNTAISNLRKEIKKPDRKSITSEEFQIPDMSFDTDEEEKLGMLKLAIEKLSEVEKAIIMLYLEEKTYDEIAEIIGISNSNVGVKLNRIKQKLEKIIKSNML